MISNGMSASNIGNGKMTFYCLNGTETDFRFLPKTKEKMRMPKRFCATCKDSVDAVGASLPEPILAQVRNKIKPYQLGAQNRLPHDLVVRQLEAWDNDDWTNPVHEEVARFGALTPLEYKTIEQFVRDCYKMPSGRLVLPQTELGPKKIRKSFSPHWNLLIANDSLFVTQPVKSLLSEMEFSGIKFFPVYTTDTEHSELYEAVIFGDGGIPEISAGGKWHQCPECENWYLQADHPVKLSVNEQQWDGSDFFHLARQGAVYVSEKAVRILSNSLLLVGSWVSFVPMHDDWIRPTLNLEGNRFS